MICCYIFSQREVLIESFVRYILDGDDVVEINEANDVLNTTVEPMDNRTIFESFVKLHLIEDIDSTSLKMPEKASRKDIGSKQ